MRELKSFLGKDRLAPVEASFMFGETPNFLVMFTSRGLQTCLASPENWKYICIYIYISYFKSNEIYIGGFGYKMIIAGHRSTCL
jgi:hypothetical protein